MKLSLVHLLHLAGSFVSATSAPSQLEQDILELLQKEKLVKKEKMNLRNLLRDPKLTDEILGSVFKPCVHNKFSGCTILVEECGMRLHLIINIFDPLELR